MPIMSQPGEELVMLIDVSSGLKFFGDGPFLFGDFIESTFDGKIVHTEYRGDLNRTAYIYYTYCDQEHFLYVGDIREIPDLFKLVKPEMNARIVVSPEYFKSTLSV